MNRNFLKTALVLAVGVAAGGFGTYYALHPHSPGLGAPPKDAHGAEEHAEHDARDQSEHGDIVKLSPEQMRELGIEVAEAGPGKLARKISVPAQINLNADHVAHIVPRVTGMVREVRKTLGDVVRTGELLAVLDSRELAESKAACLAAQARWDLAKANRDRVEALFDEKISPQKELLKVRQELAEIDIEHRTTEAKLHALGLSQEQVAALHRDEKDIDFPRYEIRAPFAGTLIEKHITLGEVVDTENTTFALADLSTVWVDITVYTKDLPQVRVGTEVDISADGFGPAHGTIAYVSPTINETTRTCFARVVLENSENRWRPGLFCLASILVAQDKIDVLVPAEAIQTINNEPVLFVEDHGGFKKRLVVTDKRNGAHVEIVSGLLPGERYVSANAFTLKSELEKAGFGEE
jgi:cobalt-zinc-cadmium efflux system membrane fusion protein